MWRVADRTDVVVYRDPAAYASHPCLTRLGDGDLLVAFNETLPRRPYLHPPDDPRSLTLVARSSDDGATWSAPRAAPGYHLTGVECPSITQISSGDVLLVQWRFEWLPLEAARERARQSGYQESFVIAGSGLSEAAPAAAEADWDAAPLAWARTDAGLCCSMSSDSGRTWHTTVPVPLAPFRRGYSPRPPVELPDGTLLLALSSHDEFGVLYVVRSTDGGRTWAEPPVVVDATVGLAEPSLLLVPGGHLLLVARHDGSGYLYQCESLDGGWTWSVPRQLPVWGYPPHLLWLADGRVLLTYGVRRSPYGIRACVSADAGRTWDVANEIIIRDDLGSANLGYPTAVELSAGRVLVVYYAEDLAGVTLIMGSQMKLPRA